MSLDKIPRYSTYRAKFEGHSGGQSKKEISKRGVKTQERFKDRLRKTKQSLAKKVLAEEEKLSSKAVNKWAIKHIIIEPESIIKFESLCVRCKLSTNLSLWQFQQCKTFLLLGFSGNWYKMLHHFHDIRPIMDKMTEFRLHVIESLIRDVKTEFTDIKWLRLGDSSNDPGFPIVLVLEREKGIEQAISVLKQKAYDHLEGPLHVTLDIHIYSREDLIRMEKDLEEMPEGHRKFFQAILPGHSRKDLIAKIENLAGVITSNKKPMNERNLAMERLLTVVDPKVEPWSIEDTPVLYEITEKLYTLASNEQLDDSFKKDALGGLIQLCFRSDDSVVSFDAARRIYHLSKVSATQSLQNVHTMALKALIQLAKQIEDGKAQALAIQELCLIISNEENLFPEYFRKEAKQVIADLIDALNQEDTQLESTLARGLRYISNYGNELAAYWAKAKQSRVHESLTDTVSHFG